METTEKSIDVLNDLIEVNYDRVKGFEKASENLESNDTDLKAVFQKLSSESRSNVTELTSGCKAIWWRGRIWHKRYRRYPQSLVGRKSNFYRS